MKIEKTPLDGILIIEPRVFPDDRGFFFESYNAEKFRALGLRTDWMQDNHSRSQQNTLRGLHFQKGKGQAKLVRCTWGSIWDVAVDIRPGSPTLGQWYGIELSAENKKMMFIEEGFAHGYCVLSPDADVLYKCTTVYDAKMESEIAWNDPDLAVAWPIAHPILSLRDINAAPFNQYLAVARP